MNAYIYNVGIFGCLSGWRHVPVFAENKEQADEKIKEVCPVEHIELIDTYSGAEICSLSKKSSSTTIEVEDSEMCKVAVTIISEKKLKPAEIQQYIKEKWPGTESWSILSRGDIIEII